jgi:hypothetical protein
LGLAYKFWPAELFGLVASYLSRTCHFHYCGGLQPSWRRVERCHRSETQVVVFTYHLSEFNSDKPLMSDTLYIEATDVSPEVRFSSVECSFLIKGRSMPENSEQFYEPVLSWLRGKYSSETVKATIDVNLDYYNTGSFIRIMGLFNLLNELNKKGSQFSVRWICEAEDEDNIADGQSFKEVVKIPFEIIEI